MFCRVAGVARGWGGEGAGVNCGGHLEIHDDIHDTEFPMLSSIILLLLMLVRLGER